jgi:DNA-binding cell septation regulator SpoVG
MTMHRDATRVNRNIEIVSIKPVDNTGNVRAFVSLRLGSIVIHGVKIVPQQGQRPSVATPDTKYETADGKVRYKQIIELTPSLRQRVAEAVLSEWENFNVR